MSNNKPVQVDLYNSIIRTNLQFGILDDVIEKPMMIFLLLNGVWFVGESGLIDGPSTLMHFVYFLGIPYLFGLVGYFLPSGWINRLITYPLFIYMAVTFDHGPFQLGVWLAEGWQMGSVSPDEMKALVAEHGVMDGIGFAIKSAYGEYAYRYFCIFLFCAIFFFPLYLIKWVNLDAARKLGGVNPFNPTFKRTKSVNRFIVWLPRLIIVAFIGFMISAMDLESTPDKMAREALAPVPVKVKSVKVEPIKVKSVEPVQKFDVEYWEGIIKAIENEEDLSWTGSSKKELEEMVPKIKAAIKSAKKAGNVI